MRTGGRPSPFPTVVFPSTSPRPRIF